MKAIESKDLQAVKILIENHLFNYDHITENGDSLLSCSIKYDSPDIYQ